MICSGPLKVSDFTEMLNNIKEARNYLGFYFHSKYTRKGLCVTDSQDMEHGCLMIFVHRKHVNKICAETE